MWVAELGVGCYSWKPQTECNCPKYSMVVADWVISPSKSVIWVVVFVRKVYCGQQIIMSDWFAMLIIRIKTKPDYYLLQKFLVASLLGCCGKWEWGSNNLNVSHGIIFKKWLDETIPIIVIKQQGKGTLLNWRASCYCVGGFNKEWVSGFAIDRVIE